MCVCHFHLLFLCVFGRHPLNLSNHTHATLYRRSHSQHTHRQTIQRRTIQLRAHISTEKKMLDDHLRDRAVKKKDQKQKLQISWKKKWLRFLNSDKIQCLNFLTHTLIRTEVFFPARGRFVATEIDMYRVLLVYREYMMTNFQFKSTQHKFTFHSWNSRIKTNKFHENGNAREQNVKRIFEMVGYLHTDRIY